MAAAQDPGYRVPCSKCPAEATIFSVLAADVRAHQAERKRLDDPNVPFEEKVVWAGDLESVPEPAAWHLTCKAHYPGDDVVDYSGELGRGRRAAVDLIRHLSEKEWVGQDTDWGNLAVRLLAPVEAALPRGRAW